MKTKEMKTKEMKTREVLVLALLALLVVATFGGFALVSRGTPAGWIGIVASVPMLVVVQRAMRVGSRPGG